MLENKFYWCRPKVCPEIGKIVAIMSYWKVTKNGLIVTSPKSRACPRATQQGSAKSGGTSPCQRSGYRKKFWRKADNKKNVEPRQ